jgi:hypothetical protein
VQGFQVPVLSEFCLKIREKLIEHGIKLDDAAIEQVYTEIMKKERALASTTASYVPKNAISETQKNKQLQVSGKFAAGFCKFLAGTLYYILPHPDTWSIGSGLVLSGVNEMIKHGDAQSNEPNL